MSKSLPSIQSGVFFTLLFLGFHLNAQLTVKADRPDATYQAGQSMNFVVTGVGGGNADYIIRYDRGQAPDITSGSVPIQGGVANIPFKLDHPGFVFCYVTAGGQTNLAGAAFSPFQIEEYEPDPADFDAFWQGWKDKLAAVPMSPVVTPLFPDPNAQTKDFRINLGHIDGRRVYGYLSIPPGEGPFPAVITHSSFGGNANFCIPRPEIALEVGAISLSIWMHNTEPDREDFNAYQPEVWNDENRIYHRYGILGVVRAMDFIESLPEYDGENLGLFGVSEGGAMSILAAGIDDRPKIVGASIFAMCEHDGFNYDRASGFPFFLLRGSSGWPPQVDPAGIKATKYYDAARAMKRFKGAFYGTTGYLDETVMPATNFSAYNNMNGPSVLVHNIDGRHLNPDEFLLGKFDFMRKHFSLSGNTGYHANAGPDVFNAKGSVSLSGNVEYNGTSRDDFEVTWEQVSGPGNIIFDNKNSKNTTATFTQQGSYVIRFRVSDKSKLARDNAYFTVSDYVIVSSDSGSNPCDNNGGDADNDGVCADVDCNDNNPLISKAGDACDDNDPLTNNDIIQADCSCKGTPIITNPCDNLGGDADGDGFCADEDCNDNNPLIGKRGSACDDGNSATTNDIVLDDCTCRGTPIPTGCNVTATANGLTIEVKNLTHPIVSLKLFDPSYNVIFTCNEWAAKCGIAETISVPAPGTYQLQIHTYIDWNEQVCNLIVPVVVTGGSVTNPCDDNGGDADNDGICANEDCDDNDSAIGAAGSACDDGDPTTTNDQLQADCSCKGTPPNPPQNGCNVTWTIDGNQLTVSGLNYEINALQLNDSNLNSYFTCSNWTKPCGQTESLTLQNGTNYLTVQTYNDWDDQICKIFEPIQVGNSTLIEELLTLHTHKKLGQVELTWYNNTGFKNDFFEIQRSKDGKHFQTFDLRLSANEGDEAHSYFALDKTPTDGMNFYRIKANFINGDVAYSTSKRVIIEEDLNDIRLSPNPAKNWVNVSLKDFEGEDVTIQLINQDGKVLRAVDLENVSDSYHQMFLRNIPNGFYTVWIFAERRRPVGKKLIIERVY